VPPPMPAALIDNELTAGDVAELHLHAPRCAIT
jgi:hypothetical protein